MKRFHHCYIFLFVVIGFAQEEKFKGQPPIKIVPTNSVPVQKQWKGIFTFDHSSVRFSNDFEGARLNGLVKDSDSTYTALITSENTPINISPWYAFKVWASRPQTIHLYLTYQDGAKHRYYPKLSRNGLQWSAIDSVDYTEFEKGEASFGPGSLPLKVALRLHIGRDTLWVAGQELQTSKHVKKWATDLAKKRHVDYQVIGKSTEGRDLHALTIGKEKSKKRSW